MGGTRPIRSRDVIPQVLKARILKKEAVPDAGSSRRCPGAAGEMRTNVAQNQASVKMAVVSTPLEAIDVTAVKDFSHLLQELNALTHARASAFLKFYKPCVRCHPAVAIMSLNLNAAAMEVEAGEISVSSALYQAPLSIRSFVHTVLGTQLTGKILMSVK
ncbi:unnamed protein product [Ranitomeya imitator]|uniref:Uncharacterized protein n=1 Tax=Ranitomeya imitator TaxID=111125 RepID=A0ABN9L6D0_9NEOB|nr:unnamed protein product [Ranitomeya imitator]